MEQEMEDQKELFEDERKEILNIEEQKEEFKENFMKKKKKTLLEGHHADVRCGRWTHHVL